MILNVESVGRGINSELKNDEKLGFTLDFWRW
jgi:hypothetical protein